MNLRNINIAIKMILAGVLALFIADLLNITYYTTASAISILSIQLTRKDFIEVGIKRLISGTFAILLASLLFYTLGHTFIVFSLFLVIFILTSWIFKISEGIVASTVIVTHLLLIDKITVGFILEEFLLLLVALSVAFLFNMFYPEFDKKTINRSLIETDNIIKKELEKIHDLLTNTYEESNVNLIKELDYLIKEAETSSKNLIIHNDYRYTNYLYMRKMQLNILLNIEKEIKELIMSHHYQIKIADFVYKISNNISFNNEAKFLLNDLNDLKTFFSNEPLPEYRVEFELRAVLFIILNELEQFLQLKIDFHESYPNFKKEREITNDIY